MAWVARPRAGRTDVARALEDGEDRIEARRAEEVLVLGDAPPIRAARAASLTRLLR